MPLDLSTNSGSVLVLHMSFAVETAQNGNSTFDAARISRFEVTRVAVPRRGLLVSREDAKTRRKRRGDVEPRMDTNGHECR